MLVRADPQQNTLSLFSFPRDLVVPIYCKDQTTPITTDRINSAWTSCGPTGTLNTVEKLTGINVNYLITIDFHGFKLLVNKLHGVYMDVDHRYLNTVGGPGGYATIDLEPGYQRLNGQQALDFVRFRHTDSDLYRVARQQLFIESLKDRLSTGVSIFQIPKLIGALKGSVEIGSGNCATCPPSFSEIESYAGLAYKLPPGHLFRVALQNLQPYGIANAELIAQTPDIQTAVTSFENPDVTQAARSTDAALGRKAKLPKGPPLKSSQISTVVLNGTAIPGLARDTSYKLSVAGFHTVQLPANVLADAPSQGYYGTTVYYDAVQANAQAGGARAQDGVRRAYDHRAAAARALRVRATGGESADRNRRRLELQRTAQQSAGACGANPAAPDGGGAQRGEPDDATRSSRFGRRCRSASSSPRRWSRARGLPTSSRCGPSSRSRITTSWR